VLALPRAGGSRSQEHGNLQPKHAKVQNHQPNPQGHVKGLREAESQSDPAAERYRHPQARGAQRGKQPHVRRLPISPTNPQQRDSRGHQNQAESGQALQQLRVAYLAALQAGQLAYPVPLQKSQTIAPKEQDKFSCCNN